ncbi:hypothetical protein PC116_g5984 [Phytophthora cactorum]|nr:hypothetical protein PC116_g5984 [Phytophthora cactorum]
MTIWKWSNGCMLTALKVVQKLGMARAATNGHVEAVRLSIGGMHGQSND